MEVKLFKWINIFSNLKRKSITNFLKINNKEHKKIKF